MPIFIKTGFWTKAKGEFKSYFNLDKFVDDKVDTSMNTLADVAKSGDYNDLINKPETKSVQNRYNNITELLEVTNIYNEQNAELSLI